MWIILKDFPLIKKGFFNDNLLFEAKLITLVFKPHNRSETYENKSKNDEEEKMEVSSLH
jgi:hypothetical protein